MILEGHCDKLLSLHGAKRSVALAFRMLLRFYGKFHCCRLVKAAGTGRAETADEVGSNPTQGRSVLSLCVSFLRLVHTIRLFFDIV